MNKTIHEHYPASKLPDELRKGIDPSGHVTVTVVEEEQRPSREKLVQLLEEARQRSRSVVDVSSERRCAAFASCGTRAERMELSQPASPQRRLGSNRRFLRNGTGLLDASLRWHDEFLFATH